MKVGNANLMNEKHEASEQIDALKVANNQFYAELGASDMELEKVVLEKAELVASLIEAKKHSSETILAISRENADLKNKITAQEREIINFQTGLLYRNDAIRHVGFGSFLNNTRVSEVKAFQSPFDVSFHQPLFGDAEAGRNLVLLQKSDSEDGVILQGVSAQVQPGTEVQIKLNGETAYFTFSGN